MYRVDPIGYFEAPQEEKYALMRQSSLMKGYQGRVILNKQSHFEEALKDLEGFERIFLIYRFHKNETWKPKVMPPRGNKKRGVFATRSPHRPNFLGLSCVKLIKVDGLSLLIEDHDLLDGTPILDIKPYLVYADAFPNAKQGWLEELEADEIYKIIWSEKAMKQQKFLEEVCKVPLSLNILPRLKSYPYPRKQNRIKILRDDVYELAYKSWRISYMIQKETQEICILEIYSGYDLQTLEGKKTSNFGDVEMHLLFLAQENFN